MCSVKLIINKRKSSLHFSLSDFGAYSLVAVSSMLKKSPMLIQIFKMIISSQK
jgi:hypothetical protein